MSKCKFTHASITPDTTHAHHFQPIRKTHEWNSFPYTWWKQTKLDTSYLYSLPWQPSHTHTHAHTHTHTQSTPMHPLTCKCYVWHTSQCPKLPGISTTLFDYTWTRADHKSNNTYDPILQHYTEHHTQYHLQHAYNCTYYITIAFDSVHTQYLQYVYNCTYSMLSRYATVFYY